MLLIITGYLYGRYGYHFAFVVIAACVLPVFFAWRKYDWWLQVLGAARAMERVQAEILFGIPMALAFGAMAWFAGRYLRKRAATKTTSP
jgi:hypothetical protein